MARELTFNSKYVKSYATKENARRAVEKKFGLELDTLTFLIVTNDEDRFVPVFIGERAAQFGVHFHFCCAS